MKDKNTLYISTSSIGFTKIVSELSEYKALREMVDSSNKLDFEIVNDRNLVNNRYTYIYIRGNDYLLYRIKHSKCWKILKKICKRLWNIGWDEKEQLDFRMYELRDDLLKHYYYDLI